MLKDKIDIMKSGWLNLVFANRNQAYGAYQLRKENARNTNKALTIALTLFVVVLASPTIANIIKGYIPAADPKPVNVENIVLPPPPSIEKVIPPPPVHEAQRPHNDMVRFPPPVVRPDPEVSETPPTDKDLEKADVGSKTLKGELGNPITVDEPVGPAEKGPSITEEDASIHNVGTIEVEPMPIGGMDKFYSFLGTKIKYPNAAKEIGTQGKVILSFVVEKDGSLTDIKAVRDPGNGLGDEAIRVLKLAPHWIPGIQNGRKVRVQYNIPVNFNLDNQ
ncbi:TonB family protein [Mucilaginibacter sp. HMF5004]|uniref:energy transducer TonB n=1 Tax=Mucilaginibacter rivuli TaxID=2857527 RepID=UPI001C5F9B01|nr:energy transducer TonB [Mucilaginibacter rivuli]MBW4889074.1 TonB family protein [Mucilaginibacter rivuli]